VRAPGRQAADLRSVTELRTRREVAIADRDGFLAGAAFLAGTTGTWLFGAIAIVLMAPILIRSRRRTGGFAAPVAVFALMVMMFTLSRVLMS
jgi:hypothetical protein